MKFETMAVLLCMMLMVISVPFINSAMNGKGSMGLIGVIPMLLFVIALLWGFSRLALREADAQLMQLLRLFDCLEAEKALRDAGVQKVADLEYLTSESLNMLSVSLITKAKLQDLLRYHLYFYPPPFILNLLCASFLSFSPSARRLNAMCIVALFRIFPPELQIHSRKVWCIHAHCLGPSACARLRNVGSRL
jgi:Na+/melibiose symporter-like transporter